MRDEPGLDVADRALVVITEHEFCPVGNEEPLKGLCSLPALSPHFCQALPSRIVVSIPQVKDLPFKAKLVHIPVAKSKGVEMAYQGEENFPAVSAALIRWDQQAWLGVPLAEVLLLPPPACF